MKFRVFKLSEMEVRASILVTILMTALLIWCDFYNSFANIQDYILSMLECLIGAFIGLIGFALSGIAIIVSLFSKSQVRKITELNGEDTLEQLLGSYKYLALSVAIQIGAFIACYVLIISDKDVAPPILFWGMVIICMYHFFFNIFYTVALTSNCIKLYRISNIYQEVLAKDKRFFDTLNEVKIDYILSIIMNIGSYNLDQVRDDMISFIERSNIDEKDKLIAYVKSAYTKNET